MTLKQLRELVEKSKKETERQWGNKEGLEATNQLIEFTSKIIKVKKYASNKKSN